MEHQSKDSARFSLIKRAKSFTHAFRGLSILFKSTHNAWIHIAVFVVVVLLGKLFHITHIEWALVLLASGFVFSAEAFNTAIEIDINLTSPEYHPYAKDTKDVAAGAVLIAAITAVCIGVCVFGPYVISFLR